MKKARFHSFIFNSLQYNFVTFLSTSACSGNVLDHHERRARGEVFP